MSMFPLKWHTQSDKPMCWVICAMYTPPHAKADATSFLLVHWCYVVFFVQIVGAMNNVSTEQHNKQTPIIIILLSEQRPLCLPYPKTFFRQTTRAKIKFQKPPQHQQQKQRPPNNSQNDQTNQHNNKHKHNNVLFAFFLFGGGGGAVPAEPPLVTCLPVVV